MFDKLRRGRADLATMNALFPAAERAAHADGLDEPGAEHLLLAALDLGDGIAKATLASFGVDAPALGAAIAGQHDEALRAVGVIADDGALATAVPAHGESRGPYRSQGSLQVAFQRAVSLAREAAAPLDSGHVLLAVAEPDRGTLARAFERLGVDRMVLRARLAGERAAG